MERIQSFRAALQHLVESPRAPFLWAFMLCVFTLTFLGQVVGATYVYSTVRLGMDGQKTQQEKKVDQEVQLIYDVEEHTGALQLTEARPKMFEEAIMQRTAKEETDSVDVTTPALIKVEDASEQKKMQGASEQKKASQ